MKKLVLPIAMAFMFSPLLNASTNQALEEETLTDCFELAEAGFQAAEGSHEDKFKVFEAVYDACMAE